MKLKKKAIAGILLLWMAATGCDGQRAVLDYAEDMLQAGQFERALELINRIDSLQNSAEVDALRGTILSLEPATMVDGMFLMNRVVDELDDPDLRRDLFVLYLDTGLYEHGANLVSGERVGPERFFRRDIVRLRSAIRCLQQPNADRAGKILEDLPAGNETSDRYDAAVRSHARFLALLCLGQGIRNRTEEKNLFWIMDEAKRNEVLQKTPVYARAGLQSLIAAFVDLMNVPENDVVAEQNRCEMIARMGPDLPDAETALREELGECKRRYPGSLVLRRVWPADLEGLNAMRGGPMLFDESPFFPEYVHRPEFEPVAEDSLPDPQYPAIRAR